MSETPYLKFPYPLSSDLVADGAVNMQQIDEAIEDVMVVPSNKLSVSSPYNGYPIGMSMMQVTSTSDWPDYGVVLTIRRQDGVQSHQYWSGSTTANPKVAFRVGTSNGWSRWIVLGSLGSPQEMASSYLLVNTKANQTVTTKVTLPQGRFTAAPRVFTQYSGTAPGACFCSPTDRTATSFTLNTWANAAWAAPMQWQALRLSTDLEGDQYAATMAAGTAVSDSTGGHTIKARAICQNPICTNYDVPINIGEMTSVDEVTGEVRQIDSVVCGVCDQSITDVIEPEGS